MFQTLIQHFFMVSFSQPTVPEAHKHRVTSGKDLGKSCGGPHRTLSTALLLNEVCEKKSRNLKRSFRNFPRNLLRNFPEILSEISRTFLAGRKVLPKISPDLSHPRFQISSRIPNQISPTILQAHFCRLGSPKEPPQNPEKFLGEGCAPRTAALRNFRIWAVQPFAFLQL